MKDILKVKFLKEKVQQGDIIKINERDSENIGITVDEETYMCRVLIDMYTTLEGTDLYRVEQHIANNSDHHWIYIHDYENAHFKSMD